MKLTELQTKLGEQIDLLTNKDMSIEDREALTGIAQIVSSLAKQMINNADVILRAEKLISEGKLNDSAISKMVK